MIICSIWFPLSQLRFKKEPLERIRSYDGGMRNETGDVVVLIQPQNSLFLFSDLLFNAFFLMHFPSRSLVDVCHSGNSVTLNMTLVTTNSPSPDSFHPDD